MITVVITDPWQAVLASFSRVRKGFRGAEPAVVGGQPWSCSAGMSPEAVPISYRMHRQLGEDSHAGSPWEMRVWGAAGSHYQSCRFTLTDLSAAPSRTSLSWGMGTLSCRKSGSADAERGTDRSLSDI